ncbi:MAG: NADH-quinone oxidoreductase subunit C [Candidatus Glassbacteria bacterium]
MDASEIYNRVKGRFGEGAGEFTPDALDPYIKVKPEHILEVAKFLSEDEELAFDSLMCLSATDYAEKVLLTYSLHSMKKFHKITLKVEVGKENPRIPSVESVWKTANWHEREAFDLLGVEFDGHPDLRRILLPEDWQGYPLRKDYTAPEEYRGMEV